MGLKKEVWRKEERLCLQEKRRNEAEHARTNQRWEHDHSTV